MNNYSFFPLFQLAMARIMVPKVSGLALQQYSQEPFKWHEIISEEKKIHQIASCKIRKNLRAWYILAKNNLLSLSVTTISWGYNLTKFYLGSHYILSYISTYYLTQSIPTTPTRRKKPEEAFIIHFLFHFNHDWNSSGGMQKNLSKQQ